MPTKPATHSYRAHVVWTGNRGSGTSTYRGYDRAHEIRSPGKPTLMCSSDPTFLGDRERYNPEELLVASLSSCHMLWYLHLAADNGIVVVDYRDDATGTMVETADGGGNSPRSRCTRSSRRAGRWTSDSPLSCTTARTTSATSRAASRFPSACEPKLVLAAETLTASPQADGA